MHWLPLVAMVIASALPFPQSPVARLVAATIEPGRNNNSTSVSKAENNMPTNLSVTNDSNGPHNDNSLNNEEAKNKTLSTPTHSSVSELPDRVSAGRRDQENALPEELSINKTIEQDLTDSTAAYPASRLHTPVEYKSKTNPDEVSLRSNDVLENYHLANHQQKSSTGAETIHQAGNTLGNASLGGSVRSSPVQEHLEGASKTKSSLEEDTTEQNGETPSFEMGNVGLWEEDQLLLLDAHPRVLFSPALSPPKHPPLLLMLELGLQTENSEESDVSRDSAPPGDPESYRNLLLGLSNSDNLSSTQKLKSGVRHKRQVAHSFQGREHSVCEAENKWTTGKKTAVDDRSKTVTILEEIQTQTGPLKQYFFETRCRKPSQRGEGQGVEGAGCLGVDKKHWTSRCQTKQSYVRALTSDDNMRVGWRWIRIDGGCVCVLLTRGSYHTEKKLERGREARRYR